jgi:hypothetical protein
MRGPCAIFYGVIRMIEQDGEYLPEELALHSDKMLVNNLMLGMD